MARDFNLSVLSGVAANTPSVVTTRNQKRICLFNLRVVEKYERADGSAAQHDNYITVEALGRNVDKCVKEVHKGERYVIHGYLRVDDVHGVEKTRVRAYYIEKE